MYKLITGIVFVFYSVLSIGATESLPAMALDFSWKELPRQTEDSIYKSFSRLKITCENTKSVLGKRACWADISEFNGVNASSITFFFKDKYLDFIRVGFPPKEHDAMLKYIRATFTHEQLSPTSQKKVGRPVKIWRSKTGIISASTEASLDHPETIMNWSSYQNMGLMPPQDSGLIEKLIFLIQKLIQMYF